MTLHWLDFDYSEDTEAVGTFDAMASTAPAQTSAVEAEIAEVVAWAEATFPHGRGVLEDGAHWDFDVQELHEDDGARRTLVLSISGSAAFCEALRERFGL
ncbi:MAG: hypothetical protein EOO26_02965 [Comamonadaceae bacterium]|nr:MAG: hypothetical protein EOO26_02965 [Comamonadaceae bacterium]